MSGPAVLFLPMPHHRLDERFVPRRGNRFRRADGRVVGKLDLTPSGDVQERFRSPGRWSLGMNYSPFAKKYDPALRLPDYLDGTAAFAQTTHLQDVEDMKKVRSVGFGGRRKLDRFQQAFPINRFGKNFCPANLEALLGRGVGRKKQNLETGKFFTERSSQV